MDVQGTRHTSLGLACITLNERYDLIGKGAEAVQRLILHGTHVDVQGGRESINKRALNVPFFPHDDAFKNEPHRQKHCFLLRADEDGRTALRLCIDYMSFASEADETDDYRYLHFFDCAMALMTRGADINLPDKRGETPIMMAVRAYGPFAMAFLTLLLKFRPDLDICDLHGMAALHHAIATFNSKAVEILLMAGANHSLVPKVGERLTPLQFAARVGNDNAVMRLVYHGADVNFYSPVPEYEATLERASLQLGTRQFFDSVLGKLWPNSAFQLPPPNRPPLSHAIERQQEGMVELLLKNGADPHDVGEQLSCGSLHL